VNAVHPGCIATPMTASAPPALRAANMAVTPLERPGQPEGVAALMVFLLSAEPSSVTGIHIPIDGGLAAQPSIGPKPYAAIRADDDMKWARVSTDCEEGLAAIEATPVVNAP
jgi:hypothetical protein